MMKKVISLFLASVLSVSLAGCGLGAKQAAKVSSGKGAELALSTDVGSIDDRSFNQGSWEGLARYSEEFGITHKYYQPTEKSDEAFTTSINLAAKGGAKVVVCPGYLYEIPIHTMQQKHPEVKFIILDGTPHSADSPEPDIGENTASIYFAEEQAGFLAGYAAVYEGYTKLGFMGGIAVPAVIRYGYGFIQGADYAAKEKGMAPGSIDMKYTYVGNFEASPENMAKAASWYNEGTEVIFSCGGPGGNSVMKAAENAGKKVIGVDVDQSAESETVITSAMKNLSKAVYDYLTDFYNGEFKGGESITLDASEDGVQLPMDTSRFTVFTQEQYDTIYEKIADNEITILKDEGITDATEIVAEYVNVKLI